MKIGSASHGRTPFDRLTFGRPSKKDARNDRVTAAAWAKHCVGKMSVRRMSVRKNVCQPNVCQPNVCQPNVC